MPKYYGLVVRENRESAWTFEFGDFDRGCVQFERDCYRDNYKASNLMIVVFAECPDASGVDEYLRELNQHLTQDPIK